MANRRMTIAALMLTLTSGQVLAQATPPTTPGKSGLPAMGPAMQVHIVKSAEPGCEPQCAEWIAAQGRIDAATLRQFKKVLSQLGTRKLPILIDSAGGTVDDALAIGRLIRAKGLDVAVTKTEFTPCAAADLACRKSKSKGALLGQPKAHLSRCASSCAFILAGGTRRYVGPWTFVGVHQFASFETQVKVLRTYRVETRQEWGVPVETRRTLVSEKRIAEKAVPTPTKVSAYQKVGVYFTEMGVGEGLMQALLATPNSTIRWLTRSELQATQIATDLVDGQQLITGVPTPRMVLPPGGPVGASAERAGAPVSVPGAAVQPRRDGSPLEPKDTAEGPSSSALGR